MRPHVVRALVWRDYLIARSFRGALLLDAVFGLLSLVIYFFISRTFANEAPAGLGGVPGYFEFAAVGVALTVVAQAASSRLAQRVREEQLTGTLEIVVAQPITTTELSLGLAGFHFLFAVLRATAYLLAAAALFGVDVSHANWPAFALVLVAGGAAMACVGIALAALVIAVRQAEVAVGVATTVLAVVGGAFFPLRVLPDAVEPLAAALPTRYLFDGVRAALYRGDGWEGACLVLAVFTALALPAAVALFGRALDVAKRRATLAAY